MHVAGGGGCSMNATEVYEGFVRFEERSAELYLDLSVRFADTLEVRWFWVEMAMEEKQHAGMLQHCREAGVFANELPGEDQITKLDSFIVLVLRFLLESAFTFERENIVFQFHVNVLGFHSGQFCFDDDFIVILKDVNRRIPGSRVEFSERIPSD